MKHNSLLKVISDRGLCFFIYTLFNYLKNV